MRERRRYWWGGEKGWKDGEKGTMGGWREGGRRYWGDGEKRWKDGEMVRWREEETEI